MEKHYDVIIVGGGIGGLMSAYKLITKNPNLKICILEKGKSLDKRKCPVSESQKCIKCNPCSIMAGLVGCGAFSDGKITQDSKVGGWLQDYIGVLKADSYISELNNILVNFGATEKVYKPNEELQIKCLQNGLQMINSSVKHLGTDNNLIIMQNLIDFLQDKIDIKTEQEVYHIDKSEDLNEYYICINDNEEYNTLCAKNIIIAVGRSGGNFVVDFCQQFKIPLKSNRVDLGVRVEMKDDVWKHFSEKIYEPKISYKTKTYEDITRMFCFNKNGLVVSENTNGVITANGHSFYGEGKKTDNCNFALLTSIKFTEPFDKPLLYVENIAKASNLIGDGNIIIQRVGDLIRGRRTTNHRLSQNSVIPTLSATAGDLSLVLPKRILDNIIETLYALDKVAPGSANDDTLFYGCEVKYYSNIPNFKDNSFEVIDGVYFIGDCSSVTRSLGQAGGMGLYVADQILENGEK